MIVENPQETHFLPTLPSRIYEDFSHAHEKARGIALKTGETVFIVRFQNSDGDVFFCLATDQQIGSPSGYQTSISVVRGSVTE